MDITHLRKQVLVEASYNFSIDLDGGGKSFFGRRRAQTPGLLVAPYDAHTLEEANDVLIVQVNVAAGNKLWKEWAPIYDEDGSRKQNWFVKIWKYLGTSEALQEFSKMYEFPEIFKISRLKGRDKIFKHLTTDFRMPIQIYQSMFGDPPAEVSEDHFVNFHGARVMMPDNIRANTKRSMLSVLDELFHVLKANGFGFLFHGDIRFMKLPGKAIGNYTPSHKTMGIQPTVKKTNEVIYTLLHEFAHKYWYEYMDEDARGKVKSKYKELRRNDIRHEADTTEIEAAKQAVTDELEPGTKVEYLGRKKAFKDIKFFTISYVQDNGQWGAHATGDPDETLRVSGGPGVFLTKRWKILGSDIEPFVTPSKYDRGGDQWFPTEYSMESYEEWWAELMTFYLYDRLQGNPKQFVDEVFGI